MTSKKHDEVDPEPNTIMASIIYLTWAILIGFGRLRDLFNISRLFKSENTSGYAPITSDFDDFYSRRAYGRIHQCWNRPLASHASTHIKVIDRERVSTEYGGYTLEMRDTGKLLDCVNLGSYNYLGFGDSDSPTRDAVLEALDQYSITTSSARVDTGTTRLHRQTEEVVARYIGKEDAIILGMGFATNSTVINTLAGPGTLLISDSNNHASIVTGARSSGAKIQVFKHNNCVDLERVIRSAIINGQPDNRGPWDKILILVEGIYSMEGEAAHLQEIVAIKKKYNCYLWVDEAHSVGAMGPTGRGICEFTGVDPANVDILMGTFTKSFGSVGGYIAANKDVISFIRSTSMGSLCSTSISAPACQQIISAMKIIMGEDGTNLGQQKISAIYNNANFFRNKLKEYGFIVLGHEGSPVVPVMLYTPASIVNFGMEASDLGLAVVVVGFPATPILLSRVRFCISAAHTIEELAEAAEKIRIIGNYLGLRFNKPNNLIETNWNA